jgi:hypothetical protein
MTYMRFSLISGTEREQIGQEFSIPLTDILNVQLDAVLLLQLGRVTTDIDPNCSVSGITSVVAEPLDEVDMGISAPSDVGEGSGRREDGGEDIKRGAGRGRTAGLTLIDDLPAVEDSRRDEMRLFGPLVFIGEMLNSTETRGA